MESGLERQVLTVCLEMHSLVDCFSTTWVIPTGLFRREILSARMETGVGMTVSRAHLADSVWNSVLRVDGMPEQRSKPEAEPDLLIRYETAARCGLMTHWPGVFRSVERSPFMSPQRPTARDLSSCGATTSTMTPLDKTVMPWTVFLTTLPTIGWICSPLTRTLREEPSGTILASVIPERILTIFFSPETVLVVMATGICLEPSMRRTCSQSLIL